MLLTRDQILQASDRETWRGPVPEWGTGEIILRGPSLVERDLFTAQLVNESRAGQKVPIGHRARLVVLCLVDEQGQRIFSDDEAAVLATKSAPVIDRLFEICQTLAGLGDGSLEEMKKNSASSPNGASASA
jgi:hypothetical protein